MRRSIVAHAPTRLDFGGGWTDVPPYPEERGGFVCNLAIDRRASARVTLSLPTTPVRLADRLPLARAACEAAGIRNADIELTNDFPVGAGLGGSSAAGVALAAALAHWNGQQMTKTDLAEWSRQVEVSGLHMAGGRQDHYAAAYGGALALSFGSAVSVKPLTLTAQCCESLERQLLLVYTGESRISGETITAVLDAYRQRVAHVVHALERMKSLAGQMAVSLEHGDITALGRLIGEHWVYQRALHPRITTNRIDRIADAATRAGAVGLKALGASGGGCVLIATTEDTTDAVARSVAQLGERLEWRIAHAGVEVRDDTPA